MPGLPFERIRQDTPESTVDDYLQRGLQDMQQRFETRWNEVNRHAGVLGRRKQMEMLAELRSKATSEILEFRQSAQQQKDQFARLDRLAEQRGFDASEAKWRMVLSPEEAAAMFPKETAPRSIASQYGELDTFEKILTDDAGNFLMDPGGKRIKEPLKFWFRESKTQPLLKVWDSDLDPQYDKEKGEWMSGGFRIANQRDIRRKLQIDEGLSDIKRRKQELLAQPDIITRVRGTMLRVKRNPIHDSLTTRVQKAAGAVAPKPATPRKVAPERQRMQPPAEHPDATWNPEHKMWTVVRDGRLMGIK